MKLALICAALVATVVTIGGAVGMRSGPVKPPPRVTPMPAATGTFNPAATSMRDGERPYNYSSSMVSQCVTRDLVICSPYWDVGNPHSRQSDLPPYGNQR